MGLQNMCPEHRYNDKERTEVIGRRRCRCGWIVGGKGDVKARFTEGTLDLLGIAVTKDQKADP